MNTLIAILVPLVIGGGALVIGQLFIARDRRRQQQFEDARSRR